MGETLRRWTNSSTVSWHLWRPAEVVVQSPSARVRRSCACAPTALIQADYLCVYVSYRGGYLASLLSRSLASTKTILQRHVGSLASTETILARAQRRSGVDSVMMACAR